MTSSLSIREDFKLNNSGHFTEDLLSPSDGEEEHSHYLAAVLPSFPVPGADEDVRDVFPEARLLVHGLALRVVDDGHVDLLEDSGLRTVCKEKEAKLEAGEESVVTFIESAPASNPGSFSNKIFIIIRNTNWNNIWLKFHWFIKPETNKFQSERTSNA